ncbi:MAG: DEAD/DEAH box helicase [Pedobacter sp.]|nr:MAG: DEAD/DEAH box helicase [Pedobacter sp.]
MAKSFEEFNLNRQILNAVADAGYTVATPIQEKAIPIILKQRDLIGCAQTGTGKTAAFALPIIQLLHTSDIVETGKKQIKTLIITPTRELAIQIGESFTSYGRHTNIEHTVIFGGVSYRAQRRALENGIDVLIATPGRLIDLMNQGFVDLKHLRIFVLDEADRMLDMGFIHDIRKILKVLPTKRQSLFFSATMPPEIVKLAENILYKPIKVEVTPVSSTADTIQQSVYFVDTAYKKDLLIHVLKDKEIVSALVFTRTKHGADKVTKLLRENNITAEAIHGNKSQNNRQLALNNFKAGRTRMQAGCCFWRPCETW